MKTTLRTNITVQDICEGFVYNELEGKGFISSCHILDVHSQGHTKKEAVKNLKEALSLFFVSCYDRGTLDNVLKECGFSSEFDKSQKTIIPKVSNIFFYSLNI